MRIGFNAENLFLYFRRTNFPNGINCVNTCYVTNLSTFAHLTIKVMIRKLFYTNFGINLLYGCSRM